MLSRSRIIAPSSSVVHVCQCKAAEIANLSTADPTAKGAHHAIGERKVGLNGISALDQRWLWVLRYGPTAPDLVVCFVDVRRDTFAYRKDDCERFSPLPTLSTCRFGNDGRRSEPAV